MEENHTQFSSATSSVVALLTDFGLKDHYVASMKGALLSSNPSATLIDISHNVEPMNVAEAGFLLWASYRSFPKGTLFLSVVDPGVGTNRSILLLETSHYTFLAPDNGLLDFVRSQERNARIFTLDIEKARTILPPLRSFTFHGRDIFAPVAGYLSKGNPVSHITSPATIPSPTKKFLSLDDRVQTPTILHVDNFGNIITNILIPTSEEGYKYLAAVHIAGKKVTTWVNTYAEAENGLPCLLVGSSGLLEIAANNDSAASILGVTTKSHIAVEWK